MQGNDPAFIEATRLALKFFPEANAFLSAEVGLDWDPFLGAMMSAHYAADHSCDPFRNPAEPDRGFSQKGGFEGDDSEIYLRLLAHAEFAPSGRAVVILDAIAAQGWSVEECLPFVCDAQKVPERLREMVCFGQARDTIFVFESGEALLVDHDERVHWARSKINRQWAK